MILDDLKIRHFGPSRAIPREKLAAHFGISLETETQDRDFRLWYSAKGIPTCNSGLYWPRGKQDREDFARFLWAHVNPKAHALRMAAFDARFPNCVPEKPPEGVQGELGI
jgi:hypothetical protein